ncbi:hypothetical protein CEXT_154241 [Caerostris extrusa]|uniref:Uncharacterized protein n=1 Tax=Caerostris extrusa TaxID=172846 RepID=A0AAV4X842_CAEEX|nr:hypothetical protein CEXT_154241 [Caerostris extrusa]
MYSHSEYLHTLFSPSTIIQIEEPECELVPPCVDLDLESTFNLNNRKSVKVILNPSDLEVKDLFPEQATSAKFDFVRLACLQCRKHFASVCGSHVDLCPDLAYRYFPSFGAYQLRS